MPIDVDFTGWPFWAIFIVVVFGLFKGEIGAGIKLLIDKFIVHKEHEDEIEEVSIESRLQAKATEIGAKWARTRYTDDMLFELLASSIEFQQDLYKRMLQAFDNFNAELRVIHNTNQRQNDLLTVNSANIAHMTDVLGKMAGSNANGASTVSF